MIVLRRLSFAALFCTLLIANVAAAAGPKVHIVVAKSAHELERFAANDMANLLKQLFDAETVITAAAPGDAENIVYVGNIFSPEMETLMKGQPFPGVEGFVLQSVMVNGRDALVLCGAGYHATAWAVYEYGWLNGVRYFPFGDLYPLEKPKFTLSGFDVRRSPTIPGAPGSIPSTIRTWVAWFPSPIGPETWGLDEQRRAGRFMMTSRFTRTHLLLPPSYPWMKYRFPVDGDTVGRAAFAGAKFFDNPDLADLAPGKAREQAIYECLNSLMKAMQYGMAINMYHGTREKLSSDSRPRENVLPFMLHNTLHEARQKEPKSNRWGTVDVANLADAALTAVYIGRHTFDAAATPAKVCEEWLTPVLGEEVHDRVMRAFNECEAASLLVQKEDDFDYPNDRMLLKHYESTEPPPAWWGEARTHYLNAMNEMYRANTRAREGGRAFTLYYARRFEFGFEYMNVIEALRKAAIAKKAGDKDAQIAELEKALDSLTNACNALAAVARGNSDRGIIAVMNEYGYRPVTKLLEEADAN